MKQAIIILVLACAACAVQGRELQQAKYKSVAEALTDKQNSQLSTLLAAVQAAGLEIPADKTWTIFAPTNKAFADASIQKQTGLSAKQLLEPANKAALTQVLQYHVVPGAAVRSTQLKDGQKLTTALTGASPLTVKINKGKVTINDNDQDAEVITADVGAGKAIIHVIDEVMIPAALVRKTGSASKPATKP